jgi:multidrug resistance protein, MATE family
VANVALALLFVLGFGWGLRGIVLATIVAVVARCAVWMPWYVLRSLGNAPRRDDRAAD